MEDKIQKEMMCYYQESAEEYSELYRGKFERECHITLNPKV